MKSVERDISRNVGCFEYQVKASNLRVWVEADEACGSDGRSYLWEGEGAEEGWRSDNVEQYGIVLISVIILLFTIQLNHTIQRVFAKLVKKIVYFIKFNVDTEYWYICINDKILKCASFFCIFQGISLCLGWKSLLYNALINTDSS